METLARLFGTEIQVKMMRLFLFNPGQAYTLNDLIDRTKGKKKEVAMTVETLQKAGLANKVSFTPRVDESERSNKKPLKEKGWMLNDSFMYRKQLQALVVGTSVVDEEEMVKRLSKAGKLKLVVVAGVFIQNWESRVDILIVGDRIKETVLKGVIKKLESEIGRELRYASLETADFQYRMSVCDRLVRDMFDFSHKVIFNKFGIKLGF